MKDAIFFLAVILIVGMISASITSRAIDYASRKNSAVDSCVALGEPCDSQA